MLEHMLENVRNTKPLIHNITNYVTVNDCANILLACGASPIMSDDAGEVEEITSICAGLCINIGTLNARTIPSMLLAGKKSNALGHPTVLDPVGAGASKLRSETAQKLLNEVQFTAIRGNLSEIKALAHGSSGTRGVDANLADVINEQTLQNVVAFAKAFSRQTNAIIAITGKIDIVTNGTVTYAIRNGHPMMSLITGTGCMLSAMTAAYLAANPGEPLQAAAAAVCAMGLCGERAYARLKPGEGNAAYRCNIIDEIFNLDKTTLEKGANYEVYE
jgi:hydroxyethylthiazole kinase